jgi:hypothetical protein
MKILFPLILCELIVLTYNGSVTFKTTDGFELTFTVNKNDDLITTCSDNSNEACSNVFNKPVRKIKFDYIEDIARRNAVYKEENLPNKLEILKDNYVFTIFKIGISDTHGDVELNYFRIARTDFIEKKIQSLLVKINKAVMFISLDLQLDDYSTITVSSNNIKYRGITYYYMEIKDLNITLKESRQHVNGAGLKLILQNKVCTDDIKINLLKKIENIANHKERNKIFNNNIVIAFNSNFLK